MTMKNEELVNDENDIDVVYVERKLTVFETFIAFSFGLDLILIGFMIGFFTVPYIRKNACEHPIIQEYKNEQKTDEVKPQLLQKTPKILELNRERMHKPGEIEYLESQKAYVLYDENGFSVVYTMEDKKFTGSQLKAFVQEKEKVDGEEDIHKP